MTDVELTMADFQAICGTLDAYDRYHDERRSKEWVGLFTEDAVYAVHGTEFHGHDGLRQFLAGRRDGAGKHHCGVPLVTMMGEDECRVEVNYFGLRRGEDGILTGGTGRYHDRLRREDGLWRFVERRIDGALRSARDITEPHTVRT
jgi:3-phenylpropionate/cinnamic acid dioxygenase small subunit